jgi:ABC-type lipoprotein export system ATPase subunit
MGEVVKAYQTGEGPFIALDGINLDVYDGEFLGITGKSGAGKTTLLNMISGVSELTSGEVLFRGDEHKKKANPNGFISIHSLDEDTKAAWRGQNVGIVYQSFELIPSLNLIENITLPQDFCGRYQPGASKERALELLELVDILKHAYKIPAHISGGQKQRVAIARALVNDPPLIIADEPTGNLDSVTAETIFQIFEKLVSQGKTIVMVTHDESLNDRFTRWVRISDGKLANNSKGQADQATAKGNAPVKIVSDTNPFGVVSSREAHSATERSADYQGEDCFAPAKTSAVRNQRSEISHDPKSAITLRDVVKTYHSPAGDFTALKGIDLQFEYGQFVSIVGKSGCGKSTLLNMITGIDHPSSGKVIVAGEDVYAMSESQRALWRGKNVGVVFQFFQLLPTLTLLENTMLPMDYCDIYPFRERPDRAMELLQQVGLEEQADKLPTAVSSGQQQSAAIARALATDPPLILADEPTGNLDSRSAETILSLFERLAGKGKTILIVTHDPALTKRTDQTVILSDGEVIDQTVAKALPYLDHPQMLAATKKADRQSYEPSSIILHQGDPVEHFYMIADGEVEVFVNTDIPATTVARLGPGQFFGEVELFNGGKSIANVRASDQRPTELALIPKEELLRLLKTAPYMREALNQVAHLRVENKEAILRAGSRA